jgi:hypothetical protein
VSLRADSAAVESIVRLVAGITVVAYAIGLFTANAYLNRIGVADFAQLRARFVLTGAIVLVGFGLAFVPVREAWQAGGRWRLVAAAALVAGVIAWFVIVSLTKGGVEEDEGFGDTELRHALLLELGALLAGFAGASLALTLFRARSGADPPVASARSGYVSERLRMMLTSATLLVGAAVFLSQFGRHVYPRIPVPYGGGKAVCGRVVLAEEAEARLDTRDLVKSRRMNAPVPIAYEADTFIVIGLGDDTWLQLRKELVEALEIGPDSRGCASETADRE